MIKLAPQWISPAGIQHLLYQYRSWCQWGCHCEAFCCTRNSSVCSKKFGRATTPSQNGNQGFVLRRFHSLEDARNSSVGVEIDCELDVWMLGVLKLPIFQPTISEAYHPKGSGVTWGKKRFPKGQNIFCLQSTKQHVESELRLNVIYGDTDSLMIDSGLADDGRGINYANALEVWGKKRLCDELLGNVCIVASILGMFFVDGK